MSGTRRDGGEAAVTHLQACPRLKDDPVASKVGAGAQAQVGAAALNVLPDPSARCQGGSGMRGAVLR